MRHRGEVDRPIRSSTRNRRNLGPVPAGCLQRQYVNGASLARTEVHGTETRTAETGRDFPRTRTVREARRVESSRRARVPTVRDPRISLGRMTEARGPCMQSPRRAGEEAEALPLLLRLALRLAGLLRHGNLGKTPTYFNEPTRGLRGDFPIPARFSHEDEPFFPAQPDQNESRIRPESRQ